MLLHVASGMYYAALLILDAKSRCMGRTGVSLTIRPKQSSLERFCIQFVPLVSHVTIDCDTVSVVMVLLMRRSEMGWDGGAEPALEVMMLC